MRSLPNFFRGMHSSNCNNYGTTSRTVSNPPISYGLWQVSHYQIFSFP
jgi:hypothetical protein